MTVKCHTNKFAKNLTVQIHKYLAKNDISFLNPLLAMSQNGQTHFKNLAANAASKGLSLPTTHIIYHQIRMAEIKSQVECGSPFFQNISELV